MNAHLSQFRPSRRIRTIEALISVMVLVWIAGSAVWAATPACAQQPRMPVSLTQAGEYGENIYDAAKAGNWSSSKSILKKLKASLVHVRAEVGDQLTGKRDLDAATAALGSAISLKNRQTAMQNANRVTFLVAEMSRPYKQRAPVELTELDYYGRELEMWSAAKDMRRLQQAASGMTTSWRTVRPRVVSHGGKAQAGKFDSLMGRLAKAKTPTDYGRLATPILDEVDMLENVFLR